MEKPSSFDFTFTDENFGKIKVSYITDEEKGIAALTALAFLSVVGFDTETYAKEKYKDDPKAGLFMCKNQCRLVQLGTKDHVYIFDMMFLPDGFKTQVSTLLSSEYPVKVAHNAKFDVKVAKKHLQVDRFGKVCCTELLSRLVKCGQHTYHISLLKSVQEHLGITLEKEEQRSDWSNTTLSESQLRYAAVDVVATLRLREALIPIAKSLEIVDAVKIDFDTIDPVADMELAGMPIDQEMWLKVDTEMMERRWDITNRLHDLIRRDVIPQQALFSEAPLATKRKDRKTITSPKAIMEFLEALDIEIPEKRNKKTGVTKKAVGKEELQKIQECHEMIPLIGEFRELAKRNSSYGINYISDYVCPECNRIHADFDPQATKTARFASNHPNLQQIPGIAQYRSCFRPSGAPLYGADSRFVIFDYSQIELRVAAELTGDPGFIAAFNSGEDFHRGTAKLLVDDPTDEKAIKEMRTPAKRINFGIIYGLGTRRLAAQLGIPIDKDDAYRLWELNKLPGVKSKKEWRAENHDLTEREPWQDVPTAADYMDKYVVQFDVLMTGLKGFGRQTVKNGGIRTWTGRLGKFSVDPKDKGSVAQAERNGMNYPIQSGSGDVLKIAIRAIYDELHKATLRARLVNIIHDEIIVEAHKDDVPDVIEIMRTEMVKAGHLVLQRVPCVVDGGYTKEGEMMTSWADKA